MKRERLQAIGGLRAIAAIHIMLYHLGSNGALDGLPLPPGIRQLFGFGNVMTGMFIALSGFVLFYSYVGHDGSLRVSSREFWLARFARTFPVMIVGHLLFIPIAFLGSAAYTMGEAIVRAVLAITVTQAWVPSLAFSYNVPAWTLSALAFYYALFPATVRIIQRLNKRQLVYLLLATWLLAVAPAATYLAWDPSQAGATSTDPGNPWSMFLHAFPLVWMPAFLSGVTLAALFVNHGWPERAHGSWLTIAGGVGMLAVVAASDRIPYYLLHNGLVAPLQWMLIVGLACDRGVIARALASAPMKTLGDASLALYILHYPPLRYLAYFIKRGWMAGNVAIPIVAYILGALWISVLATRYIIDPFAKWLRARAKQRNVLVPVAQGQ